MAFKLGVVVCGKRSSRWVLLEAMLMRAMQLANAMDGSEVASRSGKWVVKGRE
jgi:hypothetical protein